MSNESLKNKILELKHYLRKYIGFYYVEKRKISLIKEILDMNSHSIIENSIALSMISDIVSPNTKSYKDLESVIEKNRIIWRIFYAYKFL